MKAIIRFVLLTLGATALLASCNLFNKEEAFVSISSKTPSFVDGKATLTVSLSEAASKSVSAAITVAGTVPSDKIICPKSVVIAAGSLSEDIPVEVNVDALEAGNYEASFKLSEVQGAKLDPSKDAVTLTLSKEAEVVAEVFISSASESFASNKAKFTLALDKAVKSPVTVNLEVLTNVEGFFAIPAASLSFTNPVTIAAGSTSAEVEVALDPANIRKGVSQYAVISIASAVNAQVATTKTKAYIEANIPLTANLRSDWTVSFAGEIEEEGVVNHGITVAGVGSNTTFYLFVEDKGTIASLFPDGMDSFVRSLNDIVVSNLGTEDAFEIFKGDGTILNKKVPVGEYEIWLMGCDAEGYLNGDYATNTFTIEPTAEMKAAYPQFLGEWTLSDPKLTWTIAEKVFGYSYTVTGLEGMDWPVTAYLNDDLELVFPTQDILDSYEVTDNNGTKHDCTVALYGIDNDPNGGYFWTGNYSIAYGKIDDNNNIVLTGGKVIDNSNKEYDLGTMIFIAQEKNGTGAWSLSGSACGLPNLLINPANIETETSPVVAASFNDFIGVWDFDGDPIEVTAGSEANTYNFVIGEGLEAIARFEDGTMTVYDQILNNFEHQNYGACARFLGGTFVYGGKPWVYYIFNNGGKAESITKIFTAQKHESGNITMVPGACMYGEYVAFTYAWVITDPSSPYVGNGNEYGSVDLDIVVKPYTAPATAPAKMGTKSVKAAKSVRFSQPALRGKTVKSAASRSFVR